MRTVFAAGGAGLSSGSFVSSPSGYVPPTPPVRKRLTRKNSGPLVSPARSSRALHLPSSTGADPEAVRWTNEMLYWLHTDLVVLDELLAVWVDSLNDFVASAISEVIGWIFFCVMLVFNDCKNEFLEIAYKARSMKTGLSFGR